MNQHQHLSQLIQQASLKYIEQAGACGKLLSVFTHEFERIMITTALEYHKGNYSATAKSLGVSRTTLYKKIKIHALKY